MKRDTSKQDQDKVISIRRSGTFEVGWKRHATQCGMYGERMMTFDVTIEGRETDCPEGWLLDNNDIPNYFTRTYRRVHTFRSCERIASQAVDDFRTICSRYGAQPDYIRVAVSGIKDSEIAVTWRKRRHA